MNATSGPAAGGSEGRGGTEVRGGRLREAGQRSSFEEAARVGHARPISSSEGRLGASGPSGMVAKRFVAFRLVRHRNYSEDRNGTPH